MFNTDKLIFKYIFGCNIRVYHPFIDLKFGDTVDRFNTINIKCILSITNRHYFSIIYYV